MCSEQKVYIQLVKGYDRRGTALQASALKKNMGSELQNHIQPKKGGVHSECLMVIGGIMNKCRLFQVHMSVVRDSKQRVSLESKQLLTMGPSAARHEDHAFCPGLVKRRPTRASVLDVGEEISNAASGERTGTTQRHPYQTIRFAREQAHTFQSQMPARKKKQNTKYRYTQRGK